MSESVRASLLESFLNGLLVLCSLSRTGFAYRDHWCCMQTLQAFEIADRKIVSRCRYAQYRGEKITLSLEGMLVTGLVHSLRQHQVGRRWIITLSVEKRSLAA